MTSKKSSAKTEFSKSSDSFKEMLHRQPYGSCSGFASSQDSLEKILGAYIDDYLSKNKAARVIASGLRVLGIGFRSIIDHMTFRTLDVDKRAQEFLRLGYAYDTQLGIIDGFFNFGDNRDIPWLNKDCPRIWHRNGSKLL